jgi:hypothetical protein
MRYEAWNLKLFKKDPGIKNQKIIDRVIYTFGIKTNDF